MIAFFDAQLSEILTADDRHIAVPADIAEAARETGAPDGVQQWAHSTGLLAPKDSVAMMATPDLEAAA